MRIGVGIGGIFGQSAGLDGQLQEIQAAEHDGFDAILVPHIRGWDALTLIALAGQRTTRIEMITGVVPVYTRHPALMAQQALTAQTTTLTGQGGEPRGRLTLGIGLAHPETVTAWWGLSYDRPARYMREYLAVLLPLLKNKTVSFRGEVHRAALSLEFPSVPAPGVLLAALAPAMLQMAGAIADGTITWMVGRAALTTHIVPHIRAAAAQAGRPVPRIVVALPVAVTDDAPGARRTIAERFKRYGELVNYRRVLDIGGAAGPEDVAIIGNETSVESQIHDLAAAGATDLVAAIIPVGPDRAGSAARTRALLKKLAGRS